MSTKKIVLVDDDEDILGLLEIVFKEKGFEVKTATGGEELFKLLPSFVPDAILLDMMMPKMSGEAVCRKIRENKTYDKVKIFFLSVLIFPEEQLDTFKNKYKISGYYNKPFIRDELVTNILNNLENPSN